MSCKEFLDKIQDRQDEALARGCRIDLVVLPLQAAQMIATQARKEGLSDHDFWVSKTGNIFLCGIRVMWSSGRLPEGQAWFRYRNSIRP